MTLRSNDLLELFVREGANGVALPDGSKMLTIRASRCNIKIFWASSGERAGAVLTANIDPSESNCALLPSSEGWAAAIASTEPLATDDADMARTVTSIAAMAFDDVPELAEIRDGIGAKLKEDLAEGQAEKAAEKIHQAIHGGARPPKGLGG